MPKSLHLAFSCPTEHLQSSGFDHYTFIPPSCDSLQDAPTEHSCSGASSRSANASELWSPTPAASSDDTIPDLNVHVPNATDPLLVDKVGVILDTKLNDLSSIGITWGGQMILEGVGSVEPVRVAVKLAAGTPVSRTRKIQRMKIFGECGKVASRSKSISAFS
ncbi:hypothetical protein BDP27DRAFT_740516 [Rhodocollybia butyracea]|uniref:Uncharacterized protein n=1 Tax=Rhodocollybia butyracea TaxID=206335 RepID=A0A9P5U7R1_9AGAR|nr:hypothetical protein BDP27DRAFT_740516 [Rhodocollybia butyracea]